MKPPTMLILGAAGFIGNQACKRYKERGWHIFAVDNMSRETAIQPDISNFYKSDASTFIQGLEGIDVVLHLAAQVSVVHSVKDPLHDFRSNAEMTLKLSRWAATCIAPPLFIYSSTNKVYGDLTGIDRPILDSHPIDPKTPYGISKACGGMYVREILPNFGFDFRQSCIWGETQQGTSDQGWVGFIRNQIRRSQPITCYGDGSQVRDLLHVSDLLDAYDLAIEGKINPGSYTVGGGEENTISFAGAVNYLGGQISSYEDWRPHDQRYFVAASDRLREAGWYPKINFRETATGILSPQLVY